MIVDYLEGIPTEPGYYFINYGNNTIKPVVVREITDSKGNRHLYVNFDILSLPVENINVNAWAGPFLFHALDVGKKEGKKEKEKEKEKEPDEACAEPGQEG